MLHLKFALNLENLADQMIDEISSVWKNPFEAPVVIFPDPKLEQWFRLRWMKKKGVLANLNKSTIDRFLFDILVGKDDSKKKLTAEMLTNVILAYLEKDDNYKTLCNEGDDEVSRYLEVDGILDYNHLFDFASKMASLFLDYETSRPKGFVGGKEGFLDKWKQGVSEKDGLFFTETKESLELREKWQRKLYSAIFHRHGNEKSLLEHVFEEETGRTDENKEYDTIPFLFKACENGNFNLDKLPKDDGKALPIFIFGLSGMGQFYRVILQKYAEQHEVYAYIQNPCMEFWEDAKLEKDSVCRRWNVSKGNWKSETGNIGKIQERMQVRDPAQLTAGKFETDIDDIPEYADSLNQENDLLASWGRSGRDNIKLWCIASDYDFDFKGNVDKDGKDAEMPQDSLLHKVQYSIAHREKMSGVTEDDLSDKSLDVTAAPTKIREIENLHTQICKLLRDGARVEDILVVSPCLDEYRTAINMVFDQTPVKDPKNENGFLHVRFAIVDSPAKASLTENALSNLFSILAQKSITRPDFFALVRNPVVQTARGIRNEEIDAWQEWVAETNTYRTRDTKADGDKVIKKDDWDKVVKRLLLAQMTTDDVSFGGNEYRPYADMACSDKASLCRFVECIESLERWIEFGCDKSKKDGDFLKKIDREQLSELSALLDEWIGMQNTPKSLKSEDIVHKRVAEALEQLYCQFSANAPKISMNIVKQSLLLAAQGTEYSCGNLFVNGVTFMKFVPNRTIPVKHLFFIGADAASFPGAKQRNTLDLRKSCYPWPGDDSPIAKNRYAFLCQLMSTSESFHLSYVNKNIKKDAELYPSSVVNDLRKFIEAGAEKDANGKSLKWKEETISLDENRDYSELWTQKSLRNKEAYEWMLLSEDERKEKIKERQEKRMGHLDAAESKENAVKLPDRVSVYSLSKFLKDPFQFRISQMLMDEDDEDVEKEQFEPVFFNGLDENAVLKKMLAAELSGKEDEYKEFLKDLELKGKLPNGVFGEKQRNALEAKKQVLLDQMNPERVQEVKDKWFFGEKIPDMQISRPDGAYWLLTGKLDWSNAKELKDVTEIFEISSSEEKNISETPLDKFITPYVKALAIIASKSGSEKCAVTISIYSCKKNKNEISKKTVSFTPEDAKGRLRDIYNEAFGEAKFSKCVPVNLLQESSSYTTIYKFKNKLLDEHGPWAYFDKKNLFNPITDIGYTVNGFEKEWKSAVEKMGALTAFSEKQPADSDNN
ncbi:exodeoxyribonuclease V subunit gamma [Fibrobacter sp.]|uniref:exodeoxyribonuclease V subunit gamma n=1 Tax=Fibrobacter sp. TaxID=35828 RepID=UPI003865D63A